MKNDKLYINGVEYKEDYVQENKAEIFEGQKLTQDFKVEVPKAIYTYSVITEETVQIVGLSV